MSLGVGTPSRDLTKEILCSSRMISMHSSTHSSQMNTVGPAISLRTSCWLLPQNEQYSVLFESPLAALVIIGSHSLGDPNRLLSLNRAPRTLPPYHCRIRAAGC